jgi:hypothetical protein
MAHPDMDRLLGTLLPFAKRMLHEYGDFHPFGAQIEADGSVQMVGADNGEEFPEALELIDLLQQSFLQDARKGKITATGICMDVRVIAPGSSEKTDAIGVSFEHAEAEPLDVFLPYRKMQNDVAYGEMFTRPAQAKIFIENRVQ